jgi:acylglycerol lipase
MERGGSGGDEMMMTSGATGRIVPVFRSVLSRRALLRVAVALHSLFLWLLLLARGLRRHQAGTGADASASEAGAGAGTWSARRWRLRLQAAEEEDVRRRRALAEEDRGTRWATFLVTGARRNALFCRLWAPAVDEMR